MFSFHKPKIYRSISGCCICKAKSSSSRFTDSKKYEAEFEKCFKTSEKRSGEICNACVLLVKRWKKLPPGTQRDWRHVVDARAGPGTKSFKTSSPVKSSSSPRKILPPKPKKIHISDDISDENSLSECSLRRPVSPSDRVLSDYSDVDDVDEDDPDYLSDVECQDVDSVTGCFADQQLTVLTAEHNNYNNNNNNSQHQKRKSSKSPRVPSKPCKKLLSESVLDDDMMVIGSNNSRASGCPEDEILKRISSFIDTSFWRKEEICCGVIFKGPNEEVVIYPKLLKPCSCRRMVRMSSTSSSSDDSSNNGSIINNNNNNNNSRSNLNGVNKINNNNNNVKNNNSNGIISKSTQNGSNIISDKNNLKLHGLNSSNSSSPSDSSSQIISTPSSTSTSNNIDMDEEVIMSTNSNNNNYEEEVVDDGYQDIIEDDEDDEVIDDEEEIISTTPSSEDVSNGTNSSYNSSIMT